MVDSHVDNVYYNTPVQCLLVEKAVTTVMVVPVMMMEVVMVVAAREVATEVKKEVEKVGEEKD